MIRVGLASAPLCRSDPEAVISLAQRANMDGIEWSSEHVPFGDRKRAEAVMMTTLRARLSIAGYAALFRVMPSGCQNFDAALESARVLQAPCMRLLAGDGDSSSDNPEARAAFIDLARYLGDKAAKRGIAIAFSLREDSWFRSYGKAATMIREIDHPFVKVAWEPEPGEDLDRAIEGLGLFSGFANSVSVRSRSPGLEELAELWMPLLDEFRKQAGSPKMGHFLILDDSYVNDSGEGSPRDSAQLGEETLIAMTRTLKKWFLRLGWNARNPK